MILINRDTDYAVRAIIYIEKSNRDIFSAAELSDELNINYPFMRQVLKKLSQEDILKTHRGRGGGFSLKKSLKDIKVLDLVNIFQGKVNMSRCLFKGHTCEEIDNCILRREIKDIENIVKQRLENITVADLKNE